MSDPGYTYCGEDVFEVTGENNWPDITQCKYFELDRRVTLSEFEYWKISEAASEIRRLEIKLATMRLLNKEGSGG